MRVTLEDAYTFLKLPYDASLRRVFSQYKDLALQYHSTSVEKFQQVSYAYTRLTNPVCSDDIDMDMETMRDMFKNMLFKSTSANGTGSIEDGTETDSDSEYSDDDYRETSKTSQEQSEQYAKELISEEEKEKKKVEKRRAKKKKRRDKKKLEKEQEMLAKTNGSGDGRNDTSNGIRSSDEGEGIDPNAAFVKKSNKKKSEIASASSKIENISSTNQLNVDRQNDMTDPGENSGAVTKKSRLTANKGNESAHNGDYPTAIHQFTEAIKLEPSDYRFYGNRSYCYDRTMQFDKALSDAEKCINLSPDWPKGYFRKGRALAGLKLFSDAEKAFTQVLRLDKSCEEASKELSRVRTQQLIDMGFPAKDAERAALNKTSLQQAIDVLLAGINTDMNISADDVYVSNDEEEETNLAASTATQKIQNIVKSKAVKPHPNNSESFTEEKKMDPRNPEGLTALWVGNVLPIVRESDLQNLFNRYGHVSSVRCLPEKYCAFVNFKSKEAAGKAMNALQNHEVKGQYLLIKFPDNPQQQNSTALTQSKMVKSPPATPLPQPIKEKKERTPALTVPASKVSGPVNGDECYFWRTTGCQFGGKCRWKHTPESRGLDRKPWQKVK